MFWEKGGNHLHFHLIQPHPTSPDKQWGLTWSIPTSPDLTWPHLISPDLTWSHSTSLDLTRTHPTNNISFLFVFYYLFFVICFYLFISFSFGLCGSFVLLLFCWESINCQSTRQIKNDGDIFLRHESTFVWPSQSILCRTHCNRGRSHCQIGVYCKWIQRYVLRCVSGLNEQEWWWAIGSPFVFLGMLWMFVRFRWLRGSWPFQFCCEFGYLEA